MGKRKAVERVERPAVITVRLPKAAYDAAQAEAWKEKMSLNSWCVYALKKAAPKPEEANPYLERTAAEELNEGRV